MRRTPKKDPPEEPPQEPIEVTIANAQCEDCDWGYEGRADDVGERIWEHEEGEQHHVNVVEERTEVVEP